ncbi:MAG TPA: hypothetical protein VH968_04585 [Gaiellaceae bacterium]|jgi:hypothetical protein
MSTRAHAAALLLVWALVGTAGLAATFSFTAVRASRSGCLGTRSADLVSIAGIGGLGLAVAALLMVGAVPRYRTAAAVGGAAAALALSSYAVVTFLAHDGAVCGF